MGASIRYAGRPRAVRILDRPNRFRVRVVGPRRNVFDAHLPNPGRMEELIVPGATRGFVLPARARGRSTSWDLVAVRHGRSLVSVDTRAPNRLVRKALGGCPGDRRRDPGWFPEVAVGRHRFDFARRARPRGPWVEFLEIKSSNLRVGRIALFPDAPTVRGAEHLRALGRLVKAGRRASVWFVVQRDDVAAFAPNRRLDPNFARAFDAARRAGVRLRARTTRPTPAGLRWGRWIPIRRNGRG